MPDTRFLDFAQKSNFATEPDDEVSQRVAEAVA
jgi:hypothetical protein